MIKQTINLAILLTVAVAANAFANDIYKWTGADGTVYYGDNPPRNANAVLVDIQSRPSSRSRAAADTPARSAAPQTAASTTSAEVDTAASQAAGPTAAEKRATAKERAAKCAEYKDRLQKITQSRRLYRQDDNGDRVYLDEAEMQAARAKSQSQVEEYCKP